MPISRLFAAAIVAALTIGAHSSGPRTVVVRAARMFDVVGGKLISPAEVLVVGDRISAVGTTLPHPAGAEVIDLGDRTLMPGLIDAHVHLFLHPGAEDLQTVQESVPQRTILATLAAKDDLMAGFTAERDMGTEGAGSADSAVRDAIDSGLIPGPRLRISGNAIDLLGGHEDAIGYNPAQHVLSNADYANSADDLVRVIREQHKQGSSFVKIYQTGPDRMVDGVLKTPYQYTTEELRAAVIEATRLGTNVGVHATGEPGALYAVRAGVASVDHANQLSPETMRLMRERHIPAVPTFAIMQYFADHAGAGEGIPGERAQLWHAMLNYKISEFKKQIAAGVPSPSAPMSARSRMEPKPSNSYSWRSTA
jgi:imidazolonepropionase-like amidohydrolase